MRGDGQDTLTILWFSNRPTHRCLPPLEFQDYTIHFSGYWLGKSVSNFTDKCYILHGASNVL